MPLQIVRVSLLGLLVACASGGGGPEWIELRPRVDGGGPTLHIVGTVEHQDLEGGIYLLRDADGTRYNPLNLPAQFRIDGTPIEAEARARDDVSAIGMVGTVVELLRIRHRDVDQFATTNLAGTRWRLTELGGTPALASSPATLEFGADGRVSGQATCNRFSGKVTISGMTLTVGPLAVTRMACGAALMAQERRYLETLGAATSYVMRPGTLELHAPVGATSLRFVPVTPP